MRVCEKAKLSSFTRLVHATFVNISVIDVQSMVIPIEDDLPSERGSPIMPSNSSSPLAFKKGAVYDYSRVAVSPMDIDVPELDDTTDTVDCDSLVSHPECATGIESNVEDSQGFSNQPIITDEFKLFKVTHAGETHFLKADKAQFLPESSTEKSLEISLVRHLYPCVVTCLIKKFYRWNVLAAGLKCQMLLLLISVCQTFAACVS